MTVDRYTKAVLTVVAVCLVWLSLGGRSVIMPVAAQGNDRVVLAGWMDENGKVWQLPKPCCGRTAGPSELPIWQVNNP